MALNIGKEILLFPARLLNGITSLLFGSYKKLDNGKIQVDKRTGQELTNPGLIGYIAIGITSVTRAIANFISNHQTAIATSFWTSLLLAGAAALTLFLWPAALTAVVSFSVFGVSIASLVGANVVAQIGVASALTAGAASILVWAGASVVNSVINVIGWCTNRNSHIDTNRHQFDRGTDHVHVNGAARSMGRMGAGAQPQPPQNGAQSDSSEAAVDGFDFDGDDEEGFEPSGPRVG